MPETKTIIIKNKTISDNAIIFSLLSILIITIAIALIGNYFKLTDDELGELMPFVLGVSVVSVLYIFYRFKKPTYLLEKSDGFLILKNVKTELLITKCQIKDAKVEYGYYNFRYRSIVNTQIPVISFQLPTLKPFRCSFVSKKPIILFWDGDDTQKNIYNVQTNLEPPNYKITPHLFGQLAKMLVLDKKLVQLKIKRM